ncbi:gluconate 2-dehydrogenase subunit 3 family protein [Novosphingobium profundi]|uniref:gluconate 2-dehydrogenase subunit 3 family protein n=1 Tax=Novosphingobium profundi TaxID=1774954 RepID=UPI001BD9F44F|nr:gluconate 2-dehydrogenase subunit 3 family protein [Novosphingobium profundi]MBT0669177.1 gluconate 2-dehydrogenase subunit 3 family protein [Novosphingobium profundi]
MSGPALTRRDFAGGAALLALALGLPAAGVALTDLDAADLSGERQRRLMDVVCERVIPRTDTPGGAATHTGDFVLLALAHGLAGTRTPLASAAVTPALAPHLRADGSLRHADWLEQALDRAAGGDFLRRAADEQTRILTRIDAAAFAKGAPFSPWTAIKGLILTGYYTSEAGGSVELRYELDPGHWNGNVPIAPGDRAFSSDWTAVDFG